MSLYCGLLFDEEVSGHWSENKEQDYWNTIASWFKSSQIFIITLVADSAPRALCYKKYLNQRDGALDPTDISIQEIHVQNVNRCLR